MYYNLFYSVIAEQTIMRIGNEANLGSVSVGKISGPWLCF